MQEIASVFNNSTPQGLTVSDDGRHMCTVVAEQQLLQTALQIAHDAAGVTYTLETISNSADCLLQKYGSLALVLTAPAGDFSALPDSFNTVLKLIQQGTRCLAAAQIMNRSVLDSYSKVVDYARVEIGYCDYEQFYVLFLNQKLHVIAIEKQGSGSVSHVPVYPRNVAKRALELNASSVILLHNHPSGVVEPSRGDIDVSNDVKIALNAVTINCHDHIIISPFGDYSFRSNGHW